MPIIKSIITNKKIAYSLTIIIWAVISYFIMSISQPVLSYFGILEPYPKIASYILSIILTLIGALSTMHAIEKERKAFDEDRWRYIFNLAVSNGKAVPYEAGYLEGKLSPEELDGYLNVRPEGWAFITERITLGPSSPGSWYTEDGDTVVANPTWSKEDMVKKYARHFGVKIRIVKK